VRSETLARLILAVILVVVPAFTLGYHFLLRHALADVRVIDIVAGAPEAGGFRPDVIRVAAGETVRLRFSVPDVTHGIAIGPGLGIDLGHVDPGQVREAQVTFDRPGRYTMYCNTWCSTSHWRMRGTIEVYDPRNPDAPTFTGTRDAVVDRLAARTRDIDAPHETRVPLPSRRLDVSHGQRVVEQFAARTRAGLMDETWQREHSPAEAWTALTAAGASGPDAWDGVAYLWRRDITTEQAAKGASLYRKNCAACHGETGDGKGPGASTLHAAGMGDHAGMKAPKTPAAFRNPDTMLGGTSEIYYAKLRRGGMGTGMPSFGPLFTPDETWLLVNHLWSFVLE
jgi:plastocyanin/mono/diheme cytochrome c family protein